MYGKKGTKGQEQSKMISQKFGRLLVLSYDEEASKQKGYDCYRVRCDCDSELVVRGLHLRNGNTKSCGCLKQHVGEDSNQYVHGLRSRAAEEHRESIRRRDDYKCQRCGKTQEQELIDTGKRFSVHHLDNNHYNDDSKNETSLCRKCHTIVTNNGNVWRPKSYRKESKS